MDRVRHVSRLSTPHDVRSAGKVALLAHAYRLGRPVPPVVVVCFDGGDHAVTGSHRVAALRQLDPSMAIEGNDRFELLDGRELERLAYEREDGEVYGLLGLLQHGDLRVEQDGYHRLVDGLCDHVGGRALEALRGQGAKKCRD